MAKDEGGDANDKEKAGADEKDSAGKAGTEGKGGAGGGAGDKGKAGDKGGSGGEKTYTQAELEAALAEDRRERKRAATAKSTKAAGKSGAGKKGDDEAEESEDLIKERQRREQLEEKLRVRDAQDSVVAAAKNAGFTNPEKIYRLVKDDLEFDDAGKPENVKDLIALAKRDFPEELAAAKPKGSADGGAGNNGNATEGANVGMNNFIRRAAGRS